MIKEGLIKIVLVVFTLFAFSVAEAQINNDTVVMTVAGKNIPLTDFIYLAKKNGGVNFSNTKSLNDYVALFKNFKLKVADAEAQGLDKKKEFMDELRNYASQLVSGYMSDSKGEDAEIRKIYDRYSTILDLSSIMFALPADKYFSKDTAVVYQKAMQAYNRIKSGEDFDKVSVELYQADTVNVMLDHIATFLPMKVQKSFENAAYSLPEGGVSLPVRTDIGYFLIKINSKRPNPGRIQVAHILVPFPDDSTISKEKGEQMALDRIQEVYEKVKAGEDFGELAKKYSGDSGSAAKGGVLPVSDPGKFDEFFEKVAFSLTTPGEVSLPVKTRFGFHLIKLIKKAEIPSFEQMKNEWKPVMAEGERNFELNRSFDEKLKEEYGFVEYPEAYSELQKLCNDYFPSDHAFADNAKDMKKTLIHVVNTDFSQVEFAHYMVRCPFSTKHYSGDFMKEVYNMFIRDIVTTAEQKNLSKKHPEIEPLMQEYRDGILLFDVSNNEVWSKPADQQAAAEKEWIKRLDEKYPVVINWTLINKLKNKKYLK